MASVTTGITVTWGTAAATTVALGEVTELRWLQGGELPQSRGSTVAQARPWTLNAGTIEVSYLRATASAAAAMYGYKGTLSIGGTARDSVNTANIVTVNLTTKAICQTLDIGAKVNDVWRYKGTFKIVQE